MRHGFSVSLVIRLLMFGAWCISFSVKGLAADFEVPSQPISAPTTATFKPLANGVLQVTPQTTMKQIRMLPPTTQVQLKSGRVVPASQVSKLADAILEIRKKGFTQQIRPQYKFSTAQGQPALQLKPGVNLREVSKRPDSDVLQLPDGRKITVGDLKKISELRRQMTGQSLLDIQPKQGALPSRTGTAIKVRSTNDIKALGDKPDSTILENNQGKRITLGELKAYSKMTGKPLGVKNEQTP